MTVAARFAANLVKERKRAGLSQEDVSWRADVHRTEISQLERGLRVPRIDTLLKLAGALEVEPAALLDGMAWKSSQPIYGRFQFPNEVQED